MKNSNLSWTDHTWSPWVGCAKVSEGCKHCYAEAWAKRAGRDFSARTRTKDWRAPMKWNQEARDQGERYRVFPSLCDWLDPMVPVEWRNDFLDLVAVTPHLDWLLLTKRPEMDPMHAIPENVWFGVTAENQARWKERTALLQKIPARVRWVSCEPLLEPIYVHGSDSWIDWIVIGGESGPRRRDCGVKAIQTTAALCWAEQIPVFVKQDCAARPGQQGRICQAIWDFKDFPREAKE